MKKFKPWLYLAVIFVAGCVTGSALTMGLASHFMHPRGPKQMSQDWLMYLTHRLNLTTDQQAKIQPILTDAGNQLQSVHREEVGRASQIMKSTNSQIAAVLTPDQQTQLEAMEKEFDHKRDKMFPGMMRSWGPPHGGLGEPPPPPPPASSTPPADSSPKP